MLVAESRSKEKPRAGVPVGIEDLVYTKGIKTTSGSIIYKDFVPTEDDVVVERLRVAGAIIIGKINVPGLGPAARATT